MNVTVLGRSPSWPDAGGACSGYLVEGDATRVLLDCGSGVFAKLRALRDYLTVDAVVLSHMHADHFLDVVPYSYALTLGPRRRPGGEDDRPRLCVPPGAIETLRAVAACWGDPDLVQRAFDVREYDPAATLELGSLRLRFAPVPHYIPAHAVQVATSTAGGRFTYGADHGPTDALCGFADDTELLMLEATLPAVPEPGAEEPRGHLTAAEAGEHAARVRAVRLVLTHLSDEQDWSRARAEAQRAFSGPVDIAREGDVYSV